MSDNRHLVDQRRRRVRRFLKERAELLRRQGSVVGAYRLVDGRRLGPYYRLALRDAGKQLSLYLGTDVDLVNEVREELRRLQAPRRQDRAHRSRLQVLRRHLALCRALWRAELERVGLELKGYEVRGWWGRDRSSPGKSSGPSPEIES